MISIVTRSRPKVFFFFFFLFFFSLSHEAFFYSSFFLRVMFLFGEPKRSSTAAVAPKTNATLSLPSLWLRFTIARPADKHAPQGKLCSSLNFCWLWKHRSRFLKMRRKDSNWASLSSLLTEAQVKREKRLKGRRDGVMKNAKNDERNCPTKDESFKLNEYPFTDSGSTDRPFAGKTLVLGRRSAHQY